MRHGHLQEMLLWALLLNVAGDDSVLSKQPDFFMTA